jgi:hypothetical protein
MADSVAGGAPEAPDLTRPHALPGAVRGRHLPGLRGHRDVSYLAMERARQRIEWALEYGEAVALLGDPGFGKTFAGDFWRQSLPCRSAWLDAPPSRSTLRLNVRIFEALFGRIDLEAREIQLEDAIREELRSSNGFVLFIDEAQRMIDKQLDVIRDYHDDRRVSFGLVLMGGQGCAHALAKQPELNDRVVARTYFTGLAGAQLHEFLCAYHPLFEATDPTLIDLINREFAMGRLRRWARFVQIGEPYVSVSDSPDQFTRRTAELTISDIRESGMEGKGGRGRPLMPRDTGR